MKATSHSKSRRTSNTISRSAEPFFTKRKDNFTSQFSGDNQASFFKPSNIQRKCKNCQVEENIQKLEAGTKPESSNSTVENKLSNKQSIHPREQNDLTIDSLHNKGFTNSNAVQIRRKLKAENHTSIKDSSLNKKVDNSNNEGRRSPLAKGASNTIQQSSNIINSSRNSPIQRKEENQTGERQKIEKTVRRLQGKIQNLKFVYFSDERWNKVKKAIHLITSKIPFPFNYLANGFLSFFSKGVFPVASAIVLPVALGALLGAILEAAIIVAVLLIIGWIIWMILEAIGEAVEEAIRCRAVKEMCIEDCMSELGTSDYGENFHKCLSDCLLEHGCMGVKLY